MNYRQPPRTVNIAVVVAIRVKALASLPYTRPLRFLFNVWIGLRQTIQRLYYLRFFLSLSYQSHCHAPWISCGSYGFFSFCFFFFGVGAPGAALYETKKFFFSRVMFFVFLYLVEYRHKGICTFFHRVYCATSATSFRGSGCAVSLLSARVTSFIFSLPFLYFHVIFSSTSFYLCVLRNITRRDTQYNLFCQRHSLFWRP